MASATCSVNIDSISSYSSLNKLYYKDSIIQIDIDSINMSSILLEEVGRCFLDKIQETYTTLWMPLMIYLAIVAVVGQLGNSMVLLVYSKKAHRSANDIFLMTIAVFDLLASVVSIPAHFYRLLHAVSYDITTLCKFTYFFNHLTTWTPAILLVPLLFTRYRRICRPFGKQILPRTAMMIITVIILAFALFLSSDFKLFGIINGPTKIPGVFLNRCYEVDTTWHIVYDFVFDLLFLSICISLVVLYALIGKEVWRQHKFRDIAKAPARPIGSNHMGDNDDVNEDKKNIQRKVKGSQKSIDKKTSFDESDACCSKMMRLPMKDESHVNIPMSREVGVRLKIRDRHIHTNEDVHANLEAEKSKLEVSNAMLRLSKRSSELEKPQLSMENCQNEHVATKQINDSTTSEQRVDITLQKLSDISTMAEKIKKESVSLKEMENSTNKTASRPTDGCCRNNLTTFHETIIETNGAFERSIEFKSCNSTAGNSQGNGTLKSKSHTNKTNLHRRILNRTSKVIFILSVAWLISFFPTMIIYALQLKEPNVLESLSDAGYSTYAIFVNFHYVNNAVNAIIYCFYDVQFWDQVKKIIRCRK